VHAHAAAERRDVGTTWLGRARRDPWRAAPRGPRRWLGPACGALVFVAAWVAILVSGLRAHDTATARTLAAGQANGRMLAAMLDQESGVRGYLLTRDPLFLDSFSTGAGTFAAESRVARRAERDQPRLTDLLEAEIAAAARWRTRATRDIAAPGRTAPVGGPRRAFRLMDAFRLANVRYERELDRAGAAALGDSRRSTILVVLGLTGLLTLLGAAGLRRSMRRERRSDRRLRALIDNSPDIVTVVDPDTRVLFQSPSVTALLGWNPQDMVGRRMAEMLHPDDEPRVVSAFARAVASHGVSDAPTQSRWRHADGSYRWIETSRNSLIDDPEVRGVVLNSRDVTDRRMLSDELTFRSLHDPLTGLANRPGLEELLGVALGRMQAGECGPTTLLLDLTDFRDVNESLGKSAGDELLLRIAARLSSRVRPGDAAACLGGDRFAVLLEAMEPGEAADAAERILSVLGAPIDLGDRRVCLHASIGLAPAAPGDTPEELLRNADLALSEAKRQGPGHIESYRCELHERAMQRLDLETDLRDGLPRGELVLHYQPIFAVATGRLVATEALVRWAHPTRGLLSPGQFLDVAEQSGLIVAIGREVLRTATRQAAEWERTHGLALEVAVNLSPLQLEHPASLVAEVRAALADAGLPPWRLVAEITESAMMREPEAAVEALVALKALGVKTSIDDFGTGYSSLSRLRALPLDGLKIPKPFIDRIADDEADFEVASGIVDLGSRLGLGLVAEGVETAEQLEAVAAIGCDLVQGFFLARPAAAADLEGLLTDHAERARVGRQQPPGGQTAAPRREPGPATFR
jgi:diguanylate cyclase (GGDEF)-like protein/PAS domain S-box-containing protein